MYKSSSSERHLYVRSHICEFWGQDTHTHTSTNTHTNTTDACICIKSLYKFHGQDHGSKAATQIHLYSFPNSNMQQLPWSRLHYSPPLQNSPPPPHTHTHLLSSVHKEFNSQAEAHLQAISNVAVELDQVMQKDWTLHPLRNPPSKVRTSEGDPGKQSGGWYVGVCERRTAGNPSSLFMLRWTLLSRFSVKAFKFITIFKLFQDFLFH